MLSGAGVEAIVVGAIGLGLEIAFMLVVFARRARFSAFSAAYAWFSLSVASLWSFYSILRLPYV